MESLGSSWVGVESGGNFFTHWCCVPAETFRPTTVLSPKTEISGDSTVLRSTCTCAPRATRDFHRLVRNVSHYFEVVEDSPMQHMVFALEPIQAPIPSTNRLPRRLRSRTEWAYQIRSNWSADLIFEFQVIVVVVSILSSRTDCCHSFHLVSRLQTLFISNLMQSVRKNANSTTKARQKHYQKSENHKKLSISPKLSDCKALG